MANEFQPGEITVRQARLLNELLHFKEQFDRLTATPPLYVKRSAGIPSLRLGSLVGSGSSECGSAITPVTLTCDEGQRTAVTTSYSLSTDDTGKLVLTPCDTTTTPLGPCSSLIPGGSPSAPIINICITAPALTAPTSDYTINYDDHLVTPNGPSITVKLPVIDPLRPPGADIFNIKNLNATAATLSGNGALIDGAATKTLVQYASVTVWTDGTNWFIE